MKHSPETLPVCPRTRQNRCTRAPRSRLLPRCLLLSRSLRGSPLLTCTPHMSDLNSTWLLSARGRWDPLAGILRVGSEVRGVHFGPAPWSPLRAERSSRCGRRGPQTAVRRLRLHLLQRDLALGPDSSGPVLRPPDSGEGRPAHVGLRLQHCRPAGLPDGSTALSPAPGTQTLPSHRRGDPAGVAV